MNSAATTAASRPSRSLCGARQHARSGHDPTRSHGAEHGEITDRPVRRTGTHAMEEWRTNAESGPKDGARLKMTNRLYSSLDERRAWMKDGAQVIPNFIPKRRFRLFLDRARHRPHPDLLLRRIRRSIIREILANAPAVGSKSIDKRRVGRQRQHHIHRIVT